MGAKRVGYTKRAAARYLCSSPFGLLHVDREYPGQRFRNAVISAVRASSPYFEHNNTIFSEMLGEDEEYQRLKKAKRAAEESLQSVISKEAWKQYLALDEICNELECARYKAMYLAGAADCKKLEE